MKTKSIRSLFTLFVLPATVFLSSCKDDDATPVNNDAEKKEKVEKVLAFREDLNFVNRFVDETVTEIPSEGGRTSFTRTIVARLKDLAPCAEAIEEELPDGSLKVILDFGDGCETEEGAEVAGGVEMIFTFNETGIEYAIDFIDYSEISSSEHQDEVVNGTVTGSFVLDLEAGTFIQEMEQDLTITHVNNLEAIYWLAQRAEMTEEGLRVLSLTSSGNFADGGQFTITATKNLLYDFSCEGDLPVEGEEMMSFQGNVIKVNYGNGTCDDEYTAK